MNRHTRAIIFSVAILTLGIGLTASFRQTTLVRSIGGAIFIIGALVVAMTIFDAIKNWGDNNKNKHHD